MGDLMILFDPFTQLRMVSKKPMIFLQCAWPHIIIVESQVSVGHQRFLLFPTCLSFDLTPSCGRRRRLKEGGISPLHPRPSHLLPLPASSPPPPSLSCWQSREDDRSTRCR